MNQVYLGITLRNSNRREIWLISWSFLQGFRAHQFVNWFALDKMLHRDFFALKPKSTVEVSQVLWTAFGPVLRPVEHTMTATCRSDSRVWSDGQWSGKWWNLTDLSQVLRGVYTKWAIVTHLNCELPWPSLCELLWTDLRYRQVLPGLKSRTTLHIF